MRDIKFKVYVRFLQEVHNVTELRQDGSVMTDGYQYAIEKGAVDLMQFTGLTDKNGVDIYEGDIVKAVCCEHFWLSTISVSDLGGCNLYAMEFCNNLTTDDDEDTWTFKRQKSTRRNNINSSMEVIGNIHQNPELTGEQHDH